MSIDLRVEYHRVDNGLKGHNFMFFLNDQYIGHYEFLHDPKAYRSFLSQGVKVYLGWLRVEEPFRRQGYAKEMAQIAFEKFGKRVSRQKALHVIDLADMINNNKQGKQIAKRMSDFYVKQEYESTNVVRGLAKQYGREFNLGIIIDSIQKSSAKLLYS